MKSRSNIAHIGFYHLHLLLVLAACIVCTIVEFAFAHRLESEYFTTHFRINMFSAILGLCLYAGAYYLIWYFFLRHDWAGLKNNKANPGWYIWMGFISFGTMISYMLSLVFILAIWHGIPIYEPIDSTDIFLITIAYSVLMPVALLIISKFRKKEQ